jgi:hypothetical protein
MPWCPSCQRFLSPPTVTPDGTCPACGRPVEPGRGRVTSTGEAPLEPDQGRVASAGEAAPGPRPEEDEEELPPIPAHLKFLGVAVIVYLGYRFWQGIEWVIHKL